MISHVTRKGSMQGISAHAPGAQGSLIALHRVASTLARACPPWRQTWDLSTKQSGDTKGWASNGPLRQVTGGRGSAPDPHARAASNRPNPASGGSKVVGDPPMAHFTQRSHRLNLSGQK